MVSKPIRAASISETKWQQVLEEARTAKKWENSTLLRSNFDNNIVFFFTFSSQITRGNT